MVGHHGQHRNIKLRYCAWVGGAFHLFLSSEPTEVIILVINDSPSHNQSFYIFRGGQSLQMLCTTAVCKYINFGGLGPPLNMQKLWFWLGESFMSKIMIWAGKCIQIMTFGTLAYPKGSMTTPQALTFCCCCLFYHFRVALCIVVFSVRNDKNVNSSYF